jgi:hypothetical protein
MPQAFLRDLDAHFSKLLKTLYASSNDCFIDEDVTQTSNRFRTV